METSHTNLTSLSRERLESSQQIHIGDIVYNVSTHALITDQGNTILEPKVGELLQYLANTQGSISRDDLIKHIWGSHGSDESLTQAISKLRRSLNDTIRPYQMIITIPRQGYKLGKPATFTCDTLQISNTPHTPPTSIGTTLTASIKSSKHFFTGFLCGVSTILIILALWVLTHPPIQVEETLFCEAGSTHPKCQIETLP